MYTLYCLPVTASLLVLPPTYVSFPLILSAFPILSSLSCLTSLFNSNTMIAPPPLEPSLFQRVHPSMPAWFDCNPVPQICHVIVLEGWKYREVSPTLVLLGEANPPRMDGR